MLKPLRSCALSMTRRFSMTSELRLVTHSLSIDDGTEEQRTLIVLAMERISKLRYEVRANIALPALSCMYPLTLRTHDFFAKPLVLTTLRRGEPHGSSN